MFSRKSCYFFVRPQRSRLEVVFWLAREVTGPSIRKSLKTTKVKYAHVVHLVHRDQVEAPLTDWLREAYGLQDVLHVAKDVKRIKKDVKRVKDVKKRAPKPKPRRAVKQTKKRKARKS